MGKAVLLLLLLNSCFIMAQNNPNMIEIRLYNNSLQDSKLVNLKREFITESKVLFSIESLGDISLIETQIDEMEGLSNEEENIECYVPSICILFYNNNDIEKVVNICLDCKKAFVHDFVSGSYGMCYFHDNTSMNNLIRTYELDQYSRGL
jgi:hypothetical protein